MKAESVTAAQPGVAPLHTPASPGMEETEAFRPPGGPTLSEIPTLQRYVMQAELARGGMGIVYRALDTALDRDVAIKVLQERYGGSDTVQHRFVDEARITARLQHPAIPPIHEIGTLPDGRPFLAMKLVKGRTLAQLLADRADATRDLDRYTAIFEDICQALAYAHSRGVIHRDLKPANVMVGAFGEVQVMDWGLAKVLVGGRKFDEKDLGSADEVTYLPPARRGRDADSETMVGDMIGTPSFMPPEQAAGDLKNIGKPSDVFGLGSILCVILTGKPPYVAEEGGDTKVMALRAKLDDAYARLDASGADTALISLAKKALSAEPKERFADAGETTAAVAAIRTHLIDRVKEAELKQARAEIKAKEQRKRGRVQVMLALSIAALLGLFGVGGWYVQKQHEDGLVRKHAQEEETRLKLEAANKASEAETDLNQAKSLRKKYLWREAGEALDKAEKAFPDVEGFPAKVADEKATLRILKDFEDIRFLPAAKAREAWDTHKLTPNYRPAFAAIGIEFPPAGDPEAAGKRLKDHPLYADLLPYVDDWILTETDPAQRNALWAATYAIRKGDDWRRTMPGKENDVPTLRKVALDMRFNPATPPLFALVADGLERNRGDGVKLLEAGCRRYPNDFWLQFQLGRAYMHPSRKQYSLAYASFLLCRSLRPESSVVSTHLGVALYRAGDQLEAVKEFNAVIRVRQFTPLLLRNFSDAMSELGFIDEALKARQQTLERTRDWTETLYAIGLSLLDKGNFAEAKDVLLEAYEENPALAWPAFWQQANTLHKRTLPLTGKKQPAKK